MLRRRIIPTAILALAPWCYIQAGELAPPVRIEAADGPIDTEVGHAAPFVADFDGDGRLDLLVGQFGGGKLKIYRNAGTNESPQYGEPVWFQAGDALGTVPSG